MYNNFICGEIYIKFYLGKIVNLVNLFVFYKNDELICYFVKEFRDFFEGFLKRYNYYESYERYLFVEEYSEGELVFYFFFSCLV